MNARDFALIALDGKQLPGWKANLLRRGKPAPPGDQRDWALSDQIVVGVVKNLLLLQNAIEHYSGKSLAGIEGLIQKILAIGLYQLKFLDRIPPSAAVDQAVEQAKRFGGQKAAGFVNAVLRNVQRQPDPPVPDLNRDPEGYAEQAFSHPREFYRRLAALLGDERALAFCRHDNAEPPRILRLFDGVEPKKLIEELQTGGEPPDVEIVPHESPGMVVARGGCKSSILSHWSKLGLAQVQDPAAARVVGKMRISPNMRVLDRCAGLGTKTLQIHEKVAGGDEIVAMDSSESRCVALRRWLVERGVTNVRVVQGASLSSVGDRVPAAFDRILVDVPCSNSGVLARRPEARYRSEVDCLAKIQREILDDTLPRLANGGIMAYSTCSVWPEENELQIRNFLSRNPGLELIEESSILPSFDETAPEKYHDGGYFAVILNSAVPGPS